MKNIIKKLIVIVSVALVAMITIVYLVVFFPTHEYSKNSVANKPFDVRAMLINSIPKNFSLQNRKIETTISLSEDELKSMILTEVNKKGKVDGIDISIENDKLDIYVRQKSLKYFPTEISIFFKSEVKEDKIKLVLDKAKFGKLNIGKENVLNKIKDNKIMFFDARPSEGEIILEDEKLKDLITIKAIKFKDHKASVDLQIEINSLADFMKLMNL
ncbi:MAG: hypothetical protein H7Y18_03765 [Clostridiaceae bacterium]|nr:hypothetical protein [Clostridiaceae bacterium]